jgi:hypothetical protein
MPGDYQSTGFTSRLKLGIHGWAEHLGRGNNAAAQAQGLRRRGRCAGDGAGATSVAGRDGTPRLAGRRGSSGAPTHAAEEEAAGGEAVELGSQRRAHRLLRDRCSCVCRRRRRAVGLVGSREGPAGAR